MRFRRYWPYCSSYFRRWLALFGIVFFVLLNVYKDQCRLETVIRYVTSTTPSSVEVLGEMRAKSQINFQPYWPGNLQNFNSSELNNSRYLYFVSESPMQNISKYGQDLFETLPNESYLAANLSVFVKGTLVKNNLTENYLIKGDDVCREQSPFLLIIIPSVASEAEVRDTIRWTWLRAAETNSWPRAFIQDQIRHIFLFGRQVNEQAKVYEQLLQESRIFGDIVMGDFLDTYKNLARKIISGLNWVRRYCPLAQCVLKADQDTFINIPLMLHVLHRAEQVNKDSFVVGLRHGYDKPPVVRDGRWGVSKEEYPLDFYPRYLYGHTYALSKRAVVDMTDTAPYVPLIAPEDAYITGIVAKVAGVPRISAASFTVCCREIYDCEVVWNKNVALPEIKKPQLLAQLWANVITGYCNNTVTFV